MKGAILWLLLALCWPASWSKMVARCPSGWKLQEYSDQCFLVQTSGQPRTFSDARNYCQSRGGDLAYIISTELKSWLSLHVGESDNVYADTCLWVGLKKVGDEWMWTEIGEGLDTFIISWEDEPGVGDCAALTANTKLRPFTCDTQLPFICHRNISTPPACDFDAEWEEQNHMCYKSPSWTNSWHDARVDCEIEGGSLATIEDDLEQQLAHDFALIAGDSLWIGLTEEGHPGDFQWADGTPLNYTMWQPDQPDLSENGYGAAVVDPDYTNGMWKVEKITDEFHFLCKKPQGACLPGWEVFEDSCYYFNTETDDSMTWMAAKDMCDGVGAAMVVLDSPAEDDFIREHTPEGEALWIGLYSDPEQRKLLWVDGTEMNFTQMSQEDIDSALTSDTQRCVLFNTIESKSAWVPVVCSNELQYVCEVAAGQPITLTPDDNMRYCPTSWDQHWHHCYLFGWTEKTWPEARRYCQWHDAELASILTWAEEAYVSTFLYGDSWLGLSDRSEENNFVWSDGSSVLITDWEEGEPSGGDENCVEMDYLSGLWSDTKCDVEQCFVCKRKASSYPLDVITTTTALPDSSACGDGWKENTETGECYYLVLEELTLADARLHCRELPSDSAQPDLVSIYSLQEQTFVFAYVSQQHLSQTSLWLGLKNTIDGLAWLDDSPAPYFNWNDGEPNNPYDQECVEMYTGTGKWNDIQCNDRRAFVCEKKGPNYVGPQPPIAPQAKCPDGWYFYEDSCYFFSDETSSWDAAASHCHTNWDSDLASINNAGENAYIGQVLGSSRSHAWVGLHDDDGGSWYWTDGSPLAWTNWGEGEPNEGGDEHCGKISTNTGVPNDDGRWRSDKCSEQHYYICRFTLILCTSGMVYEAGMCYWTSEYAVSWSTGRTQCQTLNTRADLVTITSQEQNDIVLGLLNDLSFYYWMGLRYDKNTTKWLWPSREEAGYTNWDANQPSNVEDGQCAALITDVSSKGKWLNYNCDADWGYACGLQPTHYYGCEDGWQSFDHYCYWYSNSDNQNEMYTFSEARALCEAVDADLVSIHSAEENDFVYSITDEEYSTVPTWIGLTDNSNAGSLKWTDGTDVTFTKWDIFLTNPFYYYPTCVYYVGDDTGEPALWSAVDCDTASYVVCKKPQEPVEISNGTGCNQGDQAYKGSCYRLGDSTLDWLSAEDDCDSPQYDSGHLVVLNDMYEASYISALVGELGSPVWIGLSSSELSEGVWSFEWVNGDPVDFTYWAEDEPSPEHGTCVAASGDKTSPGLWYVSHCQDTFNYICEYPRQGYTTPTPEITTMIPGSGQCLSDWHHVNDRCYKVMNSSYTWGQGEQVCVSYGGHLVSIGSLSEQTIIQSFPELGEVDDIYNSVWIGLKAGAESGYEWTDGTPFNFIDWDVNQPDTDDARKECGSANVYSLKFSVSYCEANLPIICEAKEGTMLTTAAPPTKPPITKCSDVDSWTLYEDNCYKFVSEMHEAPQSWWQAHVLCREEGGELASIHSHEENYWIEAMISDLPDVMLWLGGRSMVDSGYEWLDSSAFDYFNWDDGEPNNAYGEEDCVSMYTHKQGYWNDKNCGYTMGRVCKRPHGATHPPQHTTQPPPGHCPHGWLHTGSKCVQVNLTLTSFAAARSACQEQGSGVNLASIHSAAEQAYITALVSGAGQDLWLGMQYNDGFHWVDQTTVTYTNWAEGEPTGHTDGDECVQVRYTTGRWVDVTCTNEYGFVCMMNQDPSVESDDLVPTCPSPSGVTFILYNGGCYWPSSTPMTWQAAEDQCVSYSSHLVSVLSVGEDSFAWVLAQEDSFTEMWVGLSNNQDHQVFKWSDGWPAVYTNWGPDQPDLNSECVAVNGTDGLWATQSCDITLPFLCKYTNESVLTPEPPVDGYCPDTHWLDLGGSYCYLFSTQRLSWSDANFNCLQEGSSMTSIHSREEMKLISMATGDITDPVWIGLVQRGSGFGWSDGTGLDYINWETGEPNSEEDKCIEMYADTGRWNDADCSSLNPSICKVKKTPKATQPVQPTLPPTDQPGSGGDGDDGSPGLSPGSIAAIVVSACVVVAVVAVVAFSCVLRKINTTNLKNVPTITKGKPRSSEGSGIIMENVIEGSEA